MLKCEGYKMFKGTVTVVPVNGRPPFKVKGTWLYKPDTECWYVQPEHELSASYTPDVLTDFEEEE